jgi:APA family basic amino acid/polyamine antiporter
VPLLPIASVCACVWLMVNLTVVTWVRFGVWMAIGIVIYLAYGRRNSLLAKRDGAAGGRVQLGNNAI